MQPAKVICNFCDSSADKVCTCTPDRTIACSRHMAEHFDSGTIEHNCISIKALPYIDLPNYKLCCRLGWMNTMETELRSNVQEFEAVIQRFTVLIAELHNSVDTFKAKILHQMEVDIVWSAKCGGIVLAA